MTTSVPAFQVLTIGSLGDTNLEASVRSFVRHITGTSNEVVQDKDKEEKKRKRGTPVRTSFGVSRNSTARDESPSKKLRNIEGDIDNTIDGPRKVLPKSIKSLYESILSAQKELEAGKSWDAEVFANV
jgi:hypothetical protein